MIFFQTSKAYAHLYVFCRKYLKINIPGLGRLLSFCDENRIINFLDSKIFFSPEIASDYGLHIIGIEQEPETHNFLNYIFDNLGQRNSTFIDVGANVGVFLIDIARRDNVQVIGFEPSVKHIESIRKSMIINSRNNYVLYSNLVGDLEKWVPFSLGKSVEGSSVFNGSIGDPIIKQICLDDIAEINCLSVDHPLILMIDVEGYEPNVLKGSSKILSKHKPLILFEYNFVSKKHFLLKDIENILGVNYKFYRLRNDSFLDSKVEDAWNCVAVPTNSVYEKALLSKILEK